MDGMIVSRPKLGELVRATAISAHFWCETNKNIRRDPYAERRKKIEAVYQESKKIDVPLSKFYAGMFGEL